MTPLVYTIPQAAQQLAVSERTLARLVAEGQIETVKIGRNRRVPAEALDDYIKRLRSAS